MKIQIKFTTVTPLCQISGIEDLKGVSYTAVQKLPMNVQFGDTKKFVSMPIYTANSFRGKLRREATNLLYTKAIEKGLSLGKNALSIGKSFHAQNAGSNVSYTNCSIEQEREIREANPVISLLGTSLAISGKINISPMFPKEMDLEGKLIYPVAKSSSDKGYLYAKCSSIRVSYKRDDLLQKSENTKLFSFEQLNEWEKLVAGSKSERQAATEKDGDIKDKKKKKPENLNAAHVISTEEVNIGTDFYGSIISSEELTQIEKGLLIRSLINLSKKQLGALNSQGRGKVDYEITFGESVIRSEWNEYGSTSISNVTLDKEAEAATNAFGSWLENIEEKNIQIEKMLEPLSKK